MSGDPLGDIDNSFRCALVPILGPLLVPANGDVVQWGRHVCLGLCSARNLVVCGSEWQFSCRALSTLTTLSMWYMYFPPERPVVRPDPYSEAGLPRTGLSIRRATCYEAFR